MFFCCQNVFEQDFKHHTADTTGHVQCFLLVDECVGHHAQLLNLSALLLGQVLHGLLGVEAGPGGAVAVDLPLVLPRLQGALERLVAQRERERRRSFWSSSTLRQAHHGRNVWSGIQEEKQSFYP